MSDGKRHYIPPKVIRQPADAQYLAFLKNENKTHSAALVGKLSSHWNSHQQYVTVVDPGTKVYRSLGRPEFTKRQAGRS